MVVWCTHGDSDGSLLHRRLLRRLFVAPTPSQLTVRCTDAALTIRADWTYLPAIGSERPERKKKRNPVYLLENKFNYELIAKRTSLGWQHELSLEEVQIDELQKEKQGPKQRGKEEQSTGKKKKKRSKRRDNRRHDHQQNHKSHAHTPSY